MRHIYLTVQDCFVIDSLLLGEEEQVRAPFRVLLDPDGLSQLIDMGAANGTWIYGRQGELELDRSRLPFVPGLGSLRWRPKAQVEHRAIGHDYGHTCWPNSIPSSPTGVRLAPRTVELLSNWRHTDTYRSPRSQGLSTRIASEGTTDSFVSEDESTWHIPMSLEPRRRIWVRATSDEAERLCQGVQIDAKAYIHVYPYGGVSVTLGFSLTFDSDRPAPAVIDLIRALIGRRGQPEFELSMRGAEPAGVPKFVKALGERVEMAIAGKTSEYRRVEPDYAISLSAEPDQVSDREVEGLLTLDPEFGEIREEWMSARASLYGKYAGDRVRATRGSLAVVTSPRLFAPSGRRRFFWRCHLIKEFATLRAITLRRIGWELRDAATARGPSEESLGRLIAIGEHLCEFHRGLPAHHRKWFYEVQGEVGAHAHDEFYGRLAELHETWAQNAIMRKVEQSGGVHFEIQTLQVANLNFGTIIGDVEANLTALSAPEVAEARDALVEFTTAVLKSDLDEDKKQELVELISVLSDEAQKDPDHRRRSVVLSTIETIGAAASVAGGLASAWTKVEPVLSGFFS